MFDAATLRLMPSARLCRVHLIRHAETLQGQVRVCRGQVDVGLSEKGIWQSNLFVERYLERYEKPAVLYSSDLSRCRYLAELLGHPVLSPQLREQNMGDWEGRSWESLSISDPEAVRAWWADYVQARPTGGESYAELYARVVHWWAPLALNAPPTVVIVSHIGVIRAFLCAWLGLSPDQALRWAPPQASLTEVLLADAGAVIERVGVELADYTSVSGILR